jgi:hypothetical protein
MMHFLLHKEKQHSHTFRIVNRATEQSKTGTFRDYGVAEAPPGFQAGWSDCKKLKYITKAREGERRGHLAEKILSSFLF